MKTGLYYLEDENVKNVIDSLDEFLKEHSPDVMFESEIYNIHEVVAQGMKRDEIAKYIIDTADLSTVKEAEEDFIENVRAGIYSNSTLDIKDAREYWNILVNIFDGNESYYSFPITQDVLYGIGILILDDAKAVELQFSATD